jgi:hypothetical protein
MAFATVVYMHCTGMSSGMELESNLNECMGLRRTDV